MRGWQLRLIAFTVLSYPALAEEQQFKGVCDASAAVALDENHFAVADDETRALRIYSFSEPDRPVLLDLTEFLGPTEDSKEPDLEGAARVGDRIYWLASHSLNSDADPQQMRRRLFATDIVSTASGPSLKTVNAPFKDLLAGLTGDPRFTGFGFAAAAEIAPEAEGGLNIEGLAAAPDGSLLIGFRNPQPGGQAIVIPLQNPSDVAEGTANPAFGEASLLDLEGRGIRSMELVDGRYLITAGPSGAGTGASSDFALYSWSGPAAGSAGALTKTGIAFPDGITPEVLFSLPESGKIMVLSDDGDMMIDGRRCKKNSVPVEKKFFRALFVDPS